MATNKIVSQESILDLNGKQTYLGNQYSVSANYTVGASEIPLILLTNQISPPNSSFSGSATTLFQNLLKVSEITASHSIVLNVYANPTFSTVAIQTITTRADSSGNLNSTYWTFYNEAGVGYYVWYNINSAGVDPTPSGLTGIKVSAATGATAVTICDDTVAAINAASTGMVASDVVSGHIITLTSSVAGPLTAYAADSTAAATSFTFAVTGGEGLALVAQNLRLSYADASIATIGSQPTISANGTLIDSISAAAQSVSFSNLLKILDSGQSILITGIASASSTSVNVLASWYEL